MRPAFALEEEHVLAQVDHADELQRDVGFAGVDFAHKRLRPVDLPFFALGHVIAHQHFRDVLLRRSALDSLVPCHRDAGHGFAARCPAGHLRLRRGNLPTLGERNHHAKTAVKVGFVAHEAAGRFVAEGQAVQQRPEIADGFDGRGGFIDL